MGLEINNVNQIKDKKIVVQNNANISSNTPVNINVGNNDEHIKKLCENFGITSEQYQEIISICPDFLSISDVEKQKEIIENYKNTAVQDLNTVIETDDGLAEAERLRAEYRMQETADKLDYNKLSSPDKKMAACIAAMAKNHFIYGEKDENGEYILRSYKRILYDSGLDDYTYIYGHTPATDFNKDMEIKIYLEKHKEIEKFIILEDNPSEISRELQNFMVICNKDKGFTEREYSYALRLLNNQPSINRGNPYIE